MTYKLHSNGVITGSLNSFCLACDLFLDTQGAAADHIGTAEHKKRLHEVQYSDKFQHEHIRKFKGGYYCEFCNVLMPIASKVNLHITEDEHKHNKGILLIKPMGDDVIAFNNIVIDAKAWHGLIDGVCSLCNAEFDDEKEHKADTKHSLNLVLKPIQFGVDNAIFRHLDDTAIQCLTCNKLLAPGRMTKHFDETEHHELYAKRRIETNRVHQGIEIEENCQGIEIEENCQGIEIEENCQGIEIEENCQRIEIEENCQGIEIEENCQGIEIEENCQGIEIEENCQGIEIEENCQGIEIEENCQRIEIEENCQGIEIEENCQGIEIEENCQGIEIEENCQRIEIEENCQRIEIEENCQGIEIEENCQGIEIEENCQGIEAKGNCQGIEAKGTSQGSVTNENYQKKPTNMSSATENYGEPKKSKIKNGNNKDVKSPTKDKSKILEFIAKYQSKGININLETETAFCKKCSKVVTFDYMEIENHIKNHSSAEAVDSDLLYPSAPDQNLNRVDINDKTTNSSDEIENNIVKTLRDKIQNLDSHEENNASKEENTETDSLCSSDFIPPVNNFEKCSQDEAISFAKANKITFSGCNNKSFCHVCGAHVPSSFKAFKEHVAGANHTRLAVSSVKKPKTPRNLAKQSTRKFVVSAYDIHGEFYDASVINEEFCIPKKSFHFITDIGIGRRRRCIMCEVNLTPLLEIEAHCETRQHAMKWEEVPIITSEKNEVIREVRPGLFHCGYCNLVVSGWSDMKQHLECSDHIENRSTWQGRLKYHLPILRRFKIRTEMEALLKFGNRNN